MVGPSGSIPGITIPQTSAQALTLGCDLDNDGRPENKLGTLFSFLRTPPPGPNIDIQESVDLAFMTGTVIQLFDVIYKPSISDTTVAGIKTFLGAHDPSDGLTAPAFYNGSGRFLTTMASAGGAFGGAIRGGVGEFGPGTLEIQFPLVSGLPPLRATLVSARVKGTFTTNGVTNAILCGAIPATDLMSRLLPQVADLLSLQIKQGGASASVLRTLFESENRCSVPECQPTAPADPPCRCIRASDIERSSIIGFLSPDVDLDRNATNPYQRDPAHREYPFDAVSLGFGLNANRAQFAVP